MSDTTRVRHLGTSTRTLLSSHQLMQCTMHSQAGTHPPGNKAATMRSASALFFAALGGAVFSLGAADAATAGGGFFGSSGVAARPRQRGFLPGWGLPRHESVFDRVSRAWVAAAEGYFSRRARRVARHRGCFRSTFFCPTLRFICRFGLINGVRRTWGHGHRRRK